MSLLDFFTGFFLMNAMPHLLVGLFDIRFLSMFGYSARANVAYAGVNVVTALVLFAIEHGLGALVDNGIVIGSLVMLAIYAITGRYFYELFRTGAEGAGQ